MLLDKIFAQKIYDKAENEMLTRGQISIETIDEIKDVLGDEFITFLYPDGNNILFKSKRWKRHFLEDKAIKRAAANPAL